MSDFLGDRHALLVLVLAGFLPNEVWRMIGLWLGAGVDEGSELLVWVRAVATAILAGVIAQILLAPPGAQGHFYQVKTKAAENAYIGPDEWLKSAPKFEGSWWPEWAKWLTAQSGELCEPPRMGPVQANDEKLPDAPGDYVHQ